jgi:hypothetical protein
MRLELSDDGALLVDYQPHRFRTESLATMTPRPTIIQVDDTPFIIDASYAKPADIFIAPAWPGHTNPEPMALATGVDSTSVRPIASETNSYSSAKMANSSDRDWPAALEDDPTREQNIAPQVFIPCRIPGIEEAAQMFRADSVYAVKLEPTIPADFAFAPCLSAQEILEAIARETAS